MRKHTQPHLHCAIFPQPAGGFLQLWTRGALHYLPHLSKTDLEMNFFDSWTICWFFCFVWSYGKNTLGLFLIVLITLKIFISTGKHIDICRYSYTYMCIYVCTSYLPYGKKTESQLEAALRSSVCDTFKSQNPAHHRAVWKRGVSQQPYPWISQVRQKAEFSLWHMGFIQISGWSHLLWRAQLGCSAPDSRNFHHQRKTFHFFFPYFFLGFIH